LKVVGKLKGLVRIITDENEPSLLAPQLLKELLQPQKYKIRVYVLRGLNLALMDLGNNS
jgi:hypothetical protein